MRYNYLQIRSIAIHRHGPLKRKCDQMLVLSKQHLCSSVHPPRQVRENGSPAKQRLIKLGAKGNHKPAFVLCTARTAWSESDQAVRTVHSCNSWWLALLWSDSVIKLVSVHFGKCTTLVGMKCWPMVIRQPCGDQWKAEKLGAFLALTNN